MDLMLRLLASGREAGEETRSQPIHKPCLDILFGYPYTCEQRNRGF